MRRWPILGPGKSLESMSSCQSISPHPDRVKYRRGAAMVGIVWRRWDKCSWSLVACALPSLLSCIWSCLVCGTAAAVLSPMARLGRSSGRCGPYGCAFRNWDAIPSLVSSGPGSFHRACLCCIGRRGLWCGDRHSVVALPCAICGAVGPARRCQVGMCWAPVSHSWLGVSPSQWSSHCRMWCIVSCTGLTRTPNVQKIILDQSWVGREVTM